MSGAVLHDGILWLAALSAQVVVLLTLLNVARTARRRRWSRHAGGHATVASSLIRGVPLAVGALSRASQPLAIRLAGQAGERADEAIERAHGLLGVDQRTLVNRRGGAVGIAALVSLGICIASRHPTSVLVGGVLLLLAARLPTLWAQRVQRDHRRGIESELPTLIEVLGLCTRAGMSLDQAIYTYCDHFTGRLRDALATARSNWVIGVGTRSQELQRLAYAVDSPPLDRFVAALRHTSEMGTPLAAVLDQQATEIREFRRAALEEEQSKVPVRMLLPIGLFTLPAMLILLMTPVVAQVVGGLAGEG